MSHAQRVWPGQTLTEEPGFPGDKRASQGVTACARPHDIGEQSAFEESRPAFMESREQGKEAQRGLRSQSLL